MEVILTSNFDYKSTTMLDISVNGHKLTLELIFNREYIIQNMQPCIIPKVIYPAKLKNGRYDIILPYLMWVYNITKSWLLATD